MDNIYEHYNKNPQDPCIYDHLTQYKDFLLFLGSHVSYHANFHNYWTVQQRYDFMLLES